MSAINEPHPDGQQDDADDFFGTGGEQEPAPETFNPEKGSFDAPSETRTPEERAEDAYQYAKSHGEPITQGMEAKHQAYLAATGQTPQAEEGEPSSEEEVPEPVAQQAKLREIAQREAAEKAAAEGNQPTAQQSADGTPGTGADASGQDEGSAEVTEPEEKAQPLPSERESVQAAADGVGKKSGDLTREYIVFHRVPLKLAVLKELLARLESGELTDAPVAWIEVDRQEARNVNGAVAASYTSHQAELGEKADLAAVSSRAFQVKHVEPKQKVETALSIT